MQRDRQTRKATRKPAQEIAMESLADELLLHVLSYTDAGLDRPSCELVCNRWRRLLAHVPWPRFFASRWNLSHAQKDWNRKLLDEMVKVRPTTDAEQEEVAAAQRARMIDDGEIDDEEDFEPRGYELHWRRTDCAVNEMGENVANAQDDAAIVTGGISLYVRDVANLLKQKYSSLSLKLAFAGAEWIARVVVKEEAENLHWHHPGRWTLTCKLERSYRHHDARKPCRNDRCPFRMLDKFPIMIRYQSRFRFGGDALDPRQLEPSRTNETHFDRSSIFSGNVDHAGFYLRERIDIRLARFACGPQSPHLRIDLEIDLVAIGKRYG